ncbi:MAG TPA: hypothetical protein VMT46_04230 [Anaerolineaceae bacterium]|nr:hypothetical protein [Anaerolineaceae bacterium]
MNEHEHRQHQPTEEPIPNQGKEAPSQHAEHAIHGQPESDYRAETAMVMDEVARAHEQHGAQTAQSMSMDMEHDHGAHMGHMSHEQMFRRRFWVSLVLSIPVLLYSQGFQMLLGFHISLSPAAGAILMSLSTVIVSINAQLLRREKL